MKDIFKKRAFRPIVAVCICLTLIITGTTICVGIASSAAVPTADRYFALITGNSTTAYTLRQYSNNAFSGSYSEPQKNVSLTTIASTLNNQNKNQSTVVYFGYDGGTVNTVSISASVNLTAGKFHITGKVSASGTARFSVTGDVSVTFDGLTYTTTATTQAIYTSSTGTVNITDCQITSNTYTVYNAGKGLINIYGNTSITSLRNVMGNSSTSTGKITVYDNAVITGGTDTSANYYGTVLSGGTAGQDILELKGNATIRSTHGPTFVNAGPGRVVVSGTGHIRSDCTTCVAYSQSNGKAGQVQLLVTENGKISTISYAAIIASGEGDVRIASGTISSAYNITILSSGTGKIMIEGGQISANGNGYSSYPGAINITGGTAGKEALVITGGTISASSTSYNAIRNMGPGKISISGDAQVTAANSSYNAIRLEAESGTAGQEILSISGSAIVAHTGTNAAINNAGVGNISISGSATVRNKNNGRVIDSSSTGKLSITGGTIDGTTNTRAINMSNASGSLNLGNFSLSNGYIETAYTMPRSLDSSYNRTTAGTYEFNMTGTTPTSSSKSTLLTSSSKKFDTSLQAEQKFPVRNTFSIGKAYELSGNNVLLYNGTPEVCPICGQNPCICPPECTHPTMSPWTTTVPAACITSGIQTRSCTDLSCDYTETQTIPALGHSMGGWATTTPATCTATGIRTRACTRTGCTHTETDVIDALGHNMGTWAVTTHATCTETGTRTRTCTRTGCTYSETDTIAATGHNWGEWQTTIPATIEEPGLDTRTCSACGQTETYVTPVLGDCVWGPWIQTTLPTCTTAGIETRTCSHDPSHTQTRAGASPLGHDFGEWVQTTAPGCITEGEDTRTCSACGQTETRPVPPFPCGDPECEDCANKNKPTDNELPKDVIPTTTWTDFFKSKWFGISIVIFITLSGCVWATSWGFSGLFKRKQ